jgi:hypothetical protein
MTDEAQKLRDEAAQAEQAKADSIERSDTDGFLSQWASGLTAQEKRLQAEIVEAGGIATFKREMLETLDGYPAPAKLIGTKYGLAWAFEDEDGKFTGEFISAHPKRTSTMEGKGYRETETLFVAPAKATIKGGGTGLAGAASCFVGIAPADSAVEYDGCLGPGDLTTKGEK